MHREIKKYVLNTIRERPTSTAPPMYSLLQESHIRYRDEAAITFFNFIINYLFINTINISFHLLNFTCVLLIWVALHVFHQLIVFRFPIAGWSILFFFASTGVLRALIVTVHEVPYIKRYFSVLRVPRKFPTIVDNNGDIIIDLSAIAIHSFLTHLLNW